MLNKIARPKLKKDMLKLRRLFKRLDASIDASAIWIAGEAGSGKTSLIASYLSEKKISTLWYEIDASDEDLSNFFYYFSQAAELLIDPQGPSLPLLTREYLQGVDTFVFRYFENLFQRLNSPTWIVLDNFQDLPDGSLLIEKLVEIIPQIPAGFKLVIVSRHVPHPRMARLRANRLLHYIDGKQLVLSIDECRRLAKTLGAKWSEKELVDIHRLTKGWVAGLILYSFHFSSPHGAKKTPSGEVPASVFDYFGSEVLESCDEHTKQFLMQTAHLPHMTLEYAKRLTKLDAETIIELLLRQHFFLEQQQLETEIYHYHPLFRDFLLQQSSRRLTKVSLTDLKNHAALILEENGNADEAIHLYCQTRNVKRLSDLILSKASLLSKQGRTNTLRRWISHLPPKVINETPWLLFWMGICLLSNDKRGSQKFLIRAFYLFKKTEDLIGQINSWSVLVETFLMIRAFYKELDKWIIEGQRLEKVIPNEMNPNIAGRFAYAFLLALSLRSPGHALIYHAQERCEKLIPHCTDKQILSLLGCYLFMSHIWLGQMNRAGNLLKQFKPIAEHPDASIMTRLNIKICLCIYYFMIGRWSEGHRIVEETMQIGEQTGIHIYDFVVMAYGAYSGPLSGNMEMAEVYRKRLEGLLSPSAVADTGQYHFIMAMFFLFAKDWVRAKFHSDKTIKLAETSGAPRPMALSLILQATLYLEQGQLENVEDTLNRISQLDVQQQSGIIFFQCALLRADFAFCCNSRSEMIGHLNAAFTDLANNGMVIPVGLSRKRLAVLCAEALLAEIEPVLVSEFIERLQLVPPLSHSVGSRWPWPIKIYTLGGLKIISSGKPLRLSKKHPKKPLEFLKLLICQNGRKLSRDVFIDQLWPDTDGDRSVQNFDTTLHRLRKFLGFTQSVLLENSRLTLNPTVCWVDAWHFESIIRQAESESTPKACEKLLTRALGIYSGPFDGIGDPQSMIFGYAESLKGKWINAIIELGRLTSERNQIDFAVHLFEDALALDGTLERLYRELIALLNENNRRTEAELWVNRYKIMLAEMGMLPSRAAMAIFEKLKATRTDVK
jgi:ATP/maltotriose-dependent transcriptional regulator MalT/DNA-binding SARP family transcriptional activator